MLRSRRLKQFVTKIATKQSDNLYLCYPKKKIAAQVDDNLFIEKTNSILIEL